MDCPTVQHRSAHDRSAADRKEEFTDDALGNRADLGDQEEPLTVTSIDGGVYRTAEAGGGAPPRPPPPPAGCRRRGGKPPLPPPPPPRPPRAVRGPPSSPPPPHHA